MFCEKCGNQIEPGALFCTECGHKVEQTVEFTENTVLQEETVVAAEEAGTFKGISPSCPASSLASI